MALASELVGGGFSPGQAAAAGGAANSAVAAAGSVQGDATAVKSSIVIATGADGTKGVILPAGMVGDEMWVFNSSASTLKVYPPVGAAICVTGSGLGTVNAAHSLLTFKCAVYKILSSTQLLVVLT